MKRNTFPNPKCNIPKVILQLRQIQWNRPTYSEIQFLPESFFFYECAWHEWIWFRYYLFPLRCVPMHGISWKDHTLLSFSISGNLLESAQYLLANAVPSHMVLVRLQYSTSNSHLPPCCHEVKSYVILWIVMLRMIALDELTWHLLVY